MFARHIKGGVVMQYVTAINKKIQKKLDKREICFACGLPFSETAPRSIDILVCEKCLKSLG
jgi:hypothetical protein